MNETIKILANRGSCKEYTSEHVSRAEIEEILAAGLNAPSGMNKQPARFVVVQNDETVKLLSKMNAAVMGRDMDPFYGATDVIIVLAKKEGTYTYDGPLAMGNLLNAAYALGLGARWIHRAKEVFASDEGKALLAKWGITEDVEGIGFCILGHPAGEVVAAPKNLDRVYYAD